MTGRILFLDTETTGLPSDSAPIEFAGNPVPIEIAFALCERDTRDSKRNIYSAYIGFNDVPCEPRAFEAHGIEPSTRESLGAPPAQVIPWVRNAILRSTTVVGHNIQFDIKMLRIAAYRAGGQQMLADFTDALAQVRVECTLELATPICRLPPTDAMRRRFPGKAFKPPNLGEAYRFFYGRDFAGAHGALADCLAARDVYYAVKDWHREHPKHAIEASLPDERNDGWGNS